MVVRVFDDFSVKNSTFLVTDLLLMLVLWSLAIKLFLSLLCSELFFNDKIGIYINPQLDLRSIVDLSPYKLLSTSLIFGLAYKLK